MALTITGAAGAARVAPQTEGQSTLLENVGGTDYDGKTCAQAGTNGYQDFLNFIAGWADGQNCTAFAAVSQIRKMCDSFLNNQELTAVPYEP